MKNIAFVLSLLALIPANVLYPMKHPTSLATLFQEFESEKERNAANNCLDIDALSDQYFNMIRSETEEDSSAEIEDAKTQTFEVEENSSHVENEIPILYPFAIRALPIGLIAPKSAAKKAVANKIQKNFPCTFEGCNKSFTQKNNLTRHMRTHRREKSFICETCNKTFGNKSHLTRHTRIHTGEKPFACEVCHKSFGDKSSLVKHMRTHEPKSFFNGYAKIVFNDGDDQK